MSTIMFLLVGIVSTGSTQTATSQPAALAMAEVQACTIEFSGPAALQGRWGGQIAVYDATTDLRGAVVALKRRIIDGREHLPPLVKLDQFESCIRRWRFGEQTDYEVSLLGGTTSGGQWVIQVKKDARVFRLRLPIAKTPG